MKTLNRLLLGLVVLIALCLGLNDDSFAVSFSFEGTWDLRIPESVKFAPSSGDPPISGKQACLNDPTCTGNKDPKIPDNEIRWGEPVKSPPGQSGLRFAGASGPILPENTEFSIGTLEHFNNPVFDPGVSQVILNLVLTLDKVPVKNFALGFLINETLDTHCENPGCEDEIGLVPLEVKELVGSGTLRIEGFRGKGKGLSDPVVLSITSPEGGGKPPVEVLAIFDRPGCQVNCNGVIPEPSTILLFGSGLAGLAAWRRFRGKHRTN